MSTRTFLDYIESNWDKVNPKMINDKETTIKDFLSGDYLPYKSKRPEESPQFKGGVKANWDRIENIAKKHVDRTNDGYVETITKKLDSAKSTTSIKQLYSKHKDTRYRDHPAVNDLFEERLKVFDIEQEKQLKVARAEIRRVSLDIDKATDLRDLEKIGDVLFDKAEKENLTSEIRGLYGKDLDRRRRELFEEEERIRENEANKTD